MSLAALPHLYCVYIYGNLSIYCIPGLHCVEQVNAHHCFVLVCPIFHDSKLLHREKVNALLCFVLAYRSNVAFMVNSKLSMVKQVNAQLIFVLANGF